MVNTSREFLEALLKGLSPEDREEVFTIIERARVDQLYAKRNPPRRRRRRQRNEAGELVDWMDVDDESP